MEADLSQLEQALKLCDAKAGNGQFIYFAGKQRRLSAGAFFVSAAFASHVSDRRNRFSHRCFFAVEIKAYGTFRPVGEAGLQSHDRCFDACGFVKLLLKTLEHVSAKFFPVHRNPLFAEPMISWIS